MGEGNILMVSQGLVLIFVILIYTFFMISIVSEILRDSELLQLNGVVGGQSSGLECTFDLGLLTMETLNVYTTSPSLISILD